LIIRGEVHGRIVGTDKVVIKRSARVSGRISAAKIEFERGVRLESVVLSGTIARKPRER
jgi:cytoskeletal protein CcmA (bactofilin family)